LSESAEDKSKRRFCEYLDLADWRYQYSFFHNDEHTAQEFAIQDSAALRKALARAFKDQPFLYRLCLTNRGYKQAREEVDEDTGEIITLPKEKPVLLPYHMFFTTKKLDYGVVSKLVNKYCNDIDEIHMLYRARTEAQIVRYRSAVKVQKPHNLKRFFGDKKINRIALLNQKAIL